MGFINSNQIVIDAVLTKIGRQMLRRGKFNVTKFALGDDQINYNLSQRDILATPILQPSSDQNTALISRLVTLSPGTTTISTLVIAAQGFPFVDNTLTVSLIANQQLTINVMNSSNLDTMFDVIVQNTDHLFVSNTNPVVINNVRSFYVLAKTAGNSRISVVGRQTGRVRYVNVASTLS